MERRHLLMLLFLFTWQTTDTNTVMRSKRESSVWIQEWPVCDTPGLNSDAGYAVLPV